MVLHAFAAMVCAPTTCAGAVYSPVADIVPTCGAIVHATPGAFGIPVTSDENCCVCPGCNVTVVGDTATFGGVNCTIAVPHRVLSATLHAVTVMFCAVTIGFGAV